jgi:DNA topoisomerase-2
LPILPLVLVNGADGIGTGWSTSIPNYNPEEIVANLQRLLAGEDPLPMAPWYRGFTGQIDEVAASRTATGKSFMATGIVTEVRSIHSKTLDG